MLKVLTQFREGDWRHAARTFWLFLAYFASQVVVQGISLVTGFLIIRILSKDEYAAYTIINTLAPVMLMLSDNGINTGLSSIGRLVWEDDRQMGALINTGLQLRRRFALFSFVIVAPFLVWMLYQKNVPLLSILLLTIVTVTGVSFQLSTAIMKMVLEWRQNIKSLGQVGVAVASLRLVLVGIFTVAFHLNALLATLAATVSTIFETSFIARAVKRQVVWDEPANPEYFPTIYSKVKQTMPLTVYFCLQSQISIWLIGLFGDKGQVADIGSATRLSVIFSIVVGSLSTILIPRFARSNGRQLLFRQVAIILASITLILTALVAFTWLFPEPFVMLLGEKYHNMSNLIWLVVLSSGMYTVANVVYGLNTCKGWIPPAYLTIPVEILTQVTLLCVLNLSQTRSVLIFTALGTIPPTLVNLGLLLRRVAHEPE